MKFSILLLYIVISQSIYSQDYMQYSILKNKARYCISVNKTDSAEIIYNQIFSTYGKLFPYDNSAALNLFVAKKDTNKVLKIITDMIHYGSNIEDFKSDPKLNFLRNLKRWNSLDTVI